MAHQSSIAAPSMIPATSLMMFPMAAAHMVESPSATPNEVSMASPAIMRMKLSMKPKPRNGTAVAKANARSSAYVGSGTSAAAAAVG